MDGKSSWWGCVDGWKVQLRYYSTDLIYQALLVATSIPVAVLYLKVLCDSLEFHKVSHPLESTFLKELFYVKPPYPKISASISLTIPILSCNCAGCHLQWSEILGTGEIAQSVNLRPHLVPMWKARHSRAHLYSECWGGKDRSNTWADSSMHTCVYIGIAYTKVHTHQKKVLLMNREKETMNVGQATNRPCYN